MVCGVRGYLLCSFVVLGSLAVLAGCSGRFFAEREPWRREAEIECFSSGAVSEGAAKVRIEPISGPGACGADFPLKVSSLGVGAPLAFEDEMRPPSIIRNAQAAPRPPDRSIDPYFAPRTRYDQPLLPDPRVVPDEPPRQPPAPYYPPVRERAPVLRPARARPALPAPPVSVTPAATLACPL